MNKLKIEIIILAIIAVLGCLAQAFDLGTGLHLRGRLSKPIPNECIETALKAQNLEYKNNQPLGDEISSYSFTNNQFAGGIYQNPQKDGKILLTVGYTWIGPSWPEEREKQLEDGFRTVMDQIRATCPSTSEELKEYNCDYVSSISKESKCPSERINP
jgi:hypothetical protein